MPGWNLVGNAYYASATVASMAGDANKVITVWAWDPVNGKWGFYMPSMTADALASYVLSKNYAVLTTINPGEGFWVNAKIGFSMHLHATTPLIIPMAAYQAGSLALPQGWNLIATGDVPTPREFANGIASAALCPGTEIVAALCPGSVAANSLTTLWAWNATTSKWLFYSPDMDNKATLSSYAVSKGFLEFAGSAATIGPGQGFWVNKP